MGDGGEKPVAKIHTSAMCACGMLLLLVAAAKAEDHSFHNAPSSVRPLKNPYANSAEAAQNGRNLYRIDCSACHGKDAEGIGPSARLSGGRVQSASPGELFWFIGRGEPEKNMPSWSYLSNEERWQLVTYLKSLKTRSKAGHEHNWQNKN